MLDPLSTCTKNHNLHNKAASSTYKSVLQQQQLSTPLRWCKKHPHLEN